MLSMKNYHQVAAILAFAMVASTLAFSLDFMQDDDIAEKLSDDLELMELEIDSELRPENGPEPLTEEMLERIQLQDGDQTTVDNTGNCTDVYPDANRCPGWARAGYCTNRSYTSWMKMYCVKSCNGCSSCFDRTTSCSRYAQAGYCARPGSFAYYSGICPISCKMCTANPANCADIYPSAICSRLTRYCGNTWVQNTCRNTCKACTACRDSQISTVCNTFKSAGYCNSTLTCTKQAMMSNCRRTCGFC